MSDVARAVELALRRPGPGPVVLNGGTGRNHSVMDRLEALRRAAIRKWVFDDEPPGVWDRTQELPSGWNSWRDPELRDIDPGDGPILVLCFDWLRQACSGQICPPPPICADLPWSGNEVL